MSTRTYEYETLEELLDARDAGEFADGYLEIVVDNDSVTARYYDRPPHEWGEDEDIEPEYLANLGGGSPAAALVEALEHLGLNARGA